ncbi:hypothetical protein D1J51_17540 [Leucobacter sp. wl10]|nr:hypothetical protein D1J51_17540 [Leucobacter sp. wl10]
MVIEKLTYLDLVIMSLGRVGDRTQIRHRSSSQVMPEPDELLSGRVDSSLVKPKVGCERSKLSLIALKKTNKNLSEHLHVSRSTRLTLKLLHEFVMILLAPEQFCHGVKNRRIPNKGFSS